MNKEIIKSNTDNTYKYIYSEGGTVYELSYINKNDGKDIICAPTQTSCNLGCKFCHLTGLNKPAQNIDGGTLFELIDDVISEIENKHDTLLISYMGAGDPLMNVGGVIGSAKVIKNKYKETYKIVRFAIASIIPKQKFMDDFEQQVKESGLDFKFHLSLHATDTELRADLMPNAMNHVAAINALNRYANNTGKTEVHYTLINNVNDTRKDLERLINSVKGINTTIKLLRYSIKNDVNMSESSKMDWFCRELNKSGIKSEIYDPPGRDIGSSCGQFEVARYN